MPRLSEQREPDIAEYSSLSGAAVAGLLLGLLSPAALVDPLAWCIPAAGMLVSLYALMRIRRYAPALTGRNAALWGLCLSLCFAAAAPADWLFSRYRIRQEARQYAGLWFDLLAAGRPERAYQLMTEPKNRQPLDEHLWEYYRENPKVRFELDHFVAPAKLGEPPAPIRTLLALGKSARIRYLDTPFQASDAGNDVLTLRYAVTFDDAGAKKTFFLGVQLFRLKSADGRAVWKIGSCASPEKMREGV
jgi:hypothetical protein